MGSKGKAKSNKVRETYQFPRSTPGAPEPPGGWPASGSGYEPDPFSPAGSWAQAARFVDAVNRRVSRKIAIPLVIVIIVLVLLGAFG